MLKFFLWFAQANRDSVLSLLFLLCTTAVSFFPALPAP